MLVYDALANPTLLAHAPQSCHFINAGKRAKDHTLTQDQINALLVQHAAAGKFVVRLKGGDPYLFGRGAEEAAYVARHGIPVEVVPGITSGLAAPAAAGIPVTHRAAASTVTLITGHEDPTKPDTSVDYAALAQLAARGGTLCFYMGVGRLATITGQLQQHGLAAATPAAAVQWGTLNRQRHVRATVATLAEAVAAAGVGAPAIIVVGAVAGLDEPGLDDFFSPARRPLFGQTVLVTRTRQQASTLRETLEDRGALVLEAPTIELRPVSDAEAAKVDQCITGLAGYDWLVLTSPGGVAALADRLEALRLDARALALVKIAAIGEATDAALRERLGVRADLMPTRSVAESLAGELLAQQGVAGKRFLLLRADIARPALPRLLAEAGAVVDDVPLYHTARPEALPDDVLAALRDGGVDWVTFTSSSTATNLVEMLGADRPLLDRVRVASIGPMTSQTLRDLGLPPHVEAADAGIAALVEALAAAGRPAD